MHVKVYIFLYISIVFISPNSEVKFFHFLKIDFRVSAARQTHEQFILNDLSQRRKVHKGHEGEEKLNIKV
jgi:hypothetical protein